MVAAAVESNVFFPMGVWHDALEVHWHGVFKSFVRLASAELEEHLKMFTSNPMQPDGSAYMRLTAG